MRALVYWRHHFALVAAVLVTVSFGVGAATAVYAVVEAVIRSLRFGNEPTVRELTCI